MSHPLIESLLETTKALKAAEPAEKEALAMKAAALTEALATDLNDMCKIACSFLDNSLPELLAQMEAADKRTEKATDSILTSTEQIMALLPKCDTEIQPQLQTQINNIFEASNFQDLVSQHINEIRLVVTTLGEDLGEVRESLHALQDGIPAASRPRKPRITRDDAHLLNGPSTIVE